MILKRLNLMRKRFSAEEKTIGLGLITLIVGHFLPWFSVEFNLNELEIQTGLTGSLGILGFVIVLMGLISLWFLVGDQLRIPLPRLSYTREQVILFLSGENAFLSLLAIAIYKRMSLEYIRADVRFGLVITVISAVMVCFGAYALKKRSATILKNESEVKKPNLDESDDSNAYPFYEDPS
ncbi:hypothetical protein IPJ72_01430 [Candidatus Peregrinibacteria bacterium]|nr:MAG: hypothetical protein IPJ72_01430 [Candidatus Peregrinibacteria bacterium]